LDKLTDEKQMELPDAIFATYQTRAAALYAYALAVLHEPLDFNWHERFQRARSKAGWEPDEGALRNLWRRRVMDDYLNLRQAGSSEAQIVPTLQRRYDRIRQDVQAMRSGDAANLFLNAYVKYLDPDGAYLGPVKAAPDRSPGGNVGIGMVLQKKENLVTVLEVVAGGPSDRSGAIFPGDQVVGVAQGQGQPMTEVIGWRLDDVVELLRGAPGSQVVVDVLPQGAARGSTPRRVPLTRAKVALEDQRAKGHVELIEHGAIAYRIGVITVPTFYQDFAARKAGAKDYQSMTRDVAAVLAQMKAEKADAILLDMRGNGGGSLIEAVDLAGLFLPGVPVVQQVSNERKVRVETAPQGVPAWDGPLAVLIDRGAAAATEITAAAIQDYGRGLVMGDISYGRGSVQTIVGLDRFSTDPMKRFGDLKLTIAVLCRANGKPIQRAGVTPDIVVPGRIDVTGKANADHFAGAACQPQDIPQRAGLDALLPTLASLHADRMQANRPYQAQLARRARDEALLSSDEVTLNEAERRRTPDARPDGDIAQLQLAEALRVLSDEVDLIRKRSGSAAGKP
jgi:carboxyl-terminal processing protease